MASHLAVLTTAAAIAASCTLFAIEHQNNSHRMVAQVENVTGASGETVSSKDVSSSRPEVRWARMKFIGQDEKDWIETGKRTNVGWITAYTFSGNEFLADQYVHHLRDSSVNVLNIDSISDDGLATICQMPRLRALVIFNSKVTDAGLEQFVNVPHLETVGFYYCSVTQAGLTRIRQQMPETHFEIYSPSRNGFVFKETGCLTSKFLATYWKKSSWR